VHRDRTVEIAGEQAARLYDAMTHPLSATWRINRAALPAALPLLGSAANAAT
jgi:hypothetical protein